MNDLNATAANHFEHCSRCKNAFRTVDGFMPNHGKRSMKCSGSWLPSLEEKARLAAAQEG